MTFPLCPNAAAQAVKAFAQGRWRYLKFRRNRAAVEAEAGAAEDKAGIIRTMDAP
jgi:hypothetical protein